MALDEQRIGRYRVIRQLGAGGMGVVFLAEDPLLKRRVAVKVVQGQAAEQEKVLAGFRREAEISARLNHPNIITIYDVGDEPGVGPFLAMELVEGQSFSQLLRGGGLATGERLRILVHVMRALGAAHAAGITHRDIKPGNVMVGGDGRVKLMDFGIARAEDSTVTISGAVVGTPSYLAPEQLRGADPSAAIDRYAFSVMTLEAICGAKPYTGDAISTILYKIVNEPPELPSTLSPKQRAVFERALAKEPGERYAKLEDFLRALIAETPLDPDSRSNLDVALRAEAALTRQPDGGDVATRALGAEEVADAAAPGASGASSRRSWLAAFVVVVLVALAGGAWWLTRAVDVRKPPPARPTMRALLPPPTAMPTAAPATPTRSAAPTPQPTAEPTPIATLEPTPTVKATPRPAATRRPPARATPVPRRPRPTATSKPAAGWGAIEHRGGERID